jgi:hypothetical protein
MWVL